MKANDIYKVLQKRAHPLSSDALGDLDLAASDVEFYYKQLLKAFRKLQKDLHCVKGADLNIALKQINVYLGFDSGATYYLPRNKHITATRRAVEDLLFRIVVYRDRLLIAINMLLKLGLSDEGVCVKNVYDALTAQRKARCTSVASNHPPDILSTALIAMRLLKSKLAREVIGLRNVTAHRAAFGIELVMSDPTVPVNELKIVQYPHNPHKRKEMSQQEFEELMDRVFVLLVQVTDSVVSIYNFQYQPPPFPVSTIDIDYDLFGLD